MGFPDYPFPNHGKSFVTHDEVLSFFEIYARKFQLDRVIKLSHQVIRVCPVQETRWEVIKLVFDRTSLILSVENLKMQVLVKNFRDNSYSTNVFDAIFVCNGHYNVPFYPNIEGRTLFKGRTMHSSDYRRPDVFKGLLIDLIFLERFFHSLRLHLPNRSAIDEDVLVIGAGPSGKDILYDIAKSANRVTISHHRDLSKHNFGTKVTQKGDVQKFTENGVEFADGTSDTFTAVLFCTGAVNNVTPLFVQR